MNEVNTAKNNISRLELEYQICGLIRTVALSMFKKLKNLETEDININVPHSSQYGDLSTNFCMKISNILKQPPRGAAEKIKKALEDEIDKSILRDYVEKIKVEGPGFLNFYLNSNVKNKWLKDIYKGTYLKGIDKIGQKQKVSVEFVSANPTGPLTIAHARQAVIGDCISNIHKVCGYKVKKEYYINNEGRQIELLGQSVEARCLQLLGEDSTIPDGGYKGDYLIDVAKEMMKSLSKDKIKNNKYTSQFYSNKAIPVILKKIKSDLSKLGVEFDKWPKQSEMTKGENLEKILKFLKEKKYLYKKDKALWFKSTKFKDSKDRVLVKKNGEYTYFAPDIVYHKQKLEDNHKLIDIWGPDHHGYVSRVKAAIKAMGYDPDLLKVLIVQLTTVFNKGKPLSMSKREGEFVSLEDVFKVLGKDATRFFLLMRKSDSHLDFDLEIAKKHSANNPVYYIQYAHARICSINRKAAGRLGKSKLTGKFKKISFENLKKLDTPFEIELINQLLKLPDDILISLKNLEPYRLIIYLQELASSFHKYYSHKRVLLKNEDLMLSRLYLCECVRKTLIKGLNLLGIESPETM